MTGLGVAQQVAVVDGAQAKELEEVVAVVDDRVVELAGVGSDELDRCVADDAEFVADQDRLRERVDVLVPYLLVDDRGEEAAGQAGVVGLFDHERRGGTDGQSVELLGGGAVAEAGDRAGGDLHRVDARQALCATMNGTDDLVEVDRLEVAVALAHHHL